MKHIYIIENLCPAFKTIFNRLYRLYREEKIYDVWTVNGHVYAAFDDEEEGVEIQSNLDIDYYLELYDIIDDKAAAKAPSHNPKALNAVNVSSSVTRVSNYLQAVSDISRESSLIQSISPSNSTTVSPSTVTLTSSGPIPSHSSNSFLTPGLVSDSNVTIRRKSNLDNVTIDTDETIITSPPSTEVTSNHIGKEAKSPAVNLTETPSIINVDMVVDIKEWLSDPNNVYIGRSISGVSHKWGNPNKNVHTIEERLNSIQLYRTHLDSNPDLLESLPELTGKNLGCHCAPLPCHAEILHEYLEKLRLGHLVTNNQSVDVTQASPSLIDDYYF